MIYIAGRKMKVFISGPITGVSDYMERFAKAEEELTKRGYIVLNPAKVTAQVPFEMPWDRYMEITLPLLKECDAIYSLDGSAYSPGARTEREFAKKLGLKEVYEHGLGD